ncbi:hypothetical protein [Brachybacterium kimchii]|uniref:Uncharacterized protein n=1 Tax=Brachybacterium kimchii TaxID=2942909 RepID=A0ABY4NB55_9MICO|nr:hypothetical protein [Brachybacterium kimchii]UQN31772.1 hypothetical protein M4486_19475 [Brachybacterium kimchii]
MTTAYARVVLDYDTSDAPAHQRDLSDFEIATLTGDGETWEDAQAACPVPEGARVLSWARWPI